MSQSSSTRFGAWVMFWSNVRRLSNTIAFRLAISLAVGSALLQILLCASLYWFLSWQINQDNNHFMDDVTSLMQTELARQDNILTVLHQQIPQELASFHFNPYQVRIVEKKDGQDAVLFQSPQFPMQLLPRLKQLPVYPIGKPPGDGVVVVGPQGKSFLIMAAEARVGVTQPRPVVIELVLDVTSKINFLNTLETGIFMLVLIGTSLFSLMGALLVRKGLTPLREFSAQIQDIRTDSLSQRMSRPDLPQELRPLATSFDRLLARLEKDVDQLTRFSGDLAHELRTPLTNLRVETEVLLAQGRTVEEYRLVLENNLVEMERLSRLVERTLLLARMDHPQFTGQWQAFPVRLLAEKLLEFYALLAEEKQIDLLDVQGDLNLTADPLLVEQAVGNLLSNAIKYTQPGGHVQIRLLTERNGDNESLGVISIKDNGFGISEEHLPHIFTRFYRGDPSRSQLISGDGLGLAIVKSIMEFHNGQVEVRSEAGQGSDFRLIFRQADTVA